MLNRTHRCLIIILCFGIGTVLTPPTSSHLSSPIVSPDTVIAAPTGQVSQALERYLKGRITSPGGKSQIKITPAPKSQQGYFQEIFITASPAQIQKKRFSQLRLRAKNLRIDPNALLNKNELKTLSSTTTLYAEVTADELTKALASGKDSSKMNLRVKFIGQQIQVSGNYNWGIFSGPFIATGKLRLSSGHKIVADVQSLKINGMEAPVFIKNKFSERINPLVDYTDLPFQPPFRKLVIRGNKAIVQA